MWREQSIRYLKRFPWTRWTSRSSTLSTTRPVKSSRERRPTCHDTLYKTATNSTRKFRIRTLFLSRMATCQRISPNLIKPLFLQYQKTLHSNLFFFFASGKPARNLCHHGWSWNLGLENASDKGVATDSVGTGNRRHVLAILLPFNCIQGTPVRTGYSIIVGLPMPWCFNRKSFSPNVIGPVIDSDTICRSRHFPANHSDNLFSITAICYDSTSSLPPGIFQGGHLAPSFLRIDGKIHFWRKFIIRNK